MNLGKEKDWTREGDETREKKKKRDSRGKKIFIHVFGKRRICLRCV